MVNKNIFYKKKKIKKMTQKFILNYTITYFIMEILNLMLLYQIILENC